MKNSVVCLAALSRHLKAALLCIAVLSLSACATPSAPLAAQGHAYTDDVFAISAKADKAYRESRWIEAARHYGKLSEMVPQDAYIWFRLGNTYAQQGAYQQAIVAYEQSLSRNSEQPKPWFNLSTAYLLKAQAAMQQSWAQMRPDDPARKLVENKLQILNALMHSRIEDTVQETRYP